jgi:hypothetical protein
VLAGAVVVHDPDVESVVVDDRARAARRGQKRRTWRGSDPDETAHSLLDTPKQQRE